MITVQPRREEALKAGFLSLQDRLNIPFEDFTKSLESWDVKAFCKGEDVVGMLMVKDSEFHVAVLPEVRGKWISKRLIKNVLGPLVNQYGLAKTRIASKEVIKNKYAERIGLNENLEILREGFEKRYFDPVTAMGVGIGASALSGIVGAGAAESAANTQASAANAATNAQLQMFNTQNQQQAPYRQAGYTALGDIMGGLGLPGGTTGATTKGQFTHQFGPQDLTANLAPNYDFILKQGQAAARNLGNVSTGESSNTTKGVLDYTMGMAQNAYQQAFENYTANQSNIFNRLSNVAGLGQTANQISANLAGSLAPGIAQTTVGAGTAKAAGTVGAANALTGGMSNALGWYSLPSIMNMGGQSSPTEYIQQG